jgi:hypothetical protein
MLFRYGFAESVAVGVVHAVAYSLLLLNTDLHVADLAVRMSRSQFVRNTLSAIQMQLQPNGSSSDIDASSTRHGSDHTGPSTLRTKRHSRWNHDSYEFDA